MITTSVVLAEECLGDVRVLSGQGVNYMLDDGDDCRAILVAGLYNVDKYLRLRLPKNPTINN